MASYCVEKNVASGRRIENYVQLAALPYRFASRDGATTYLGPP